MSRSRKQRNLTSPGLLKRLEDRLQKERLGHQEFQSFVCWMLFICALLALIIPTGLVVADIRDFGCIGEEFTIVAHYGLYGWMGEMFEDFKNHMTTKRDKGEIDYEVCYRLVISETAPLQRKYEPSVYQPQIYYWLNASQTEWRNKKTRRQTLRRTGKWFVKYPEESCTPIAEVPMGLIIREEFKDAFDYENPIDFQEIMDLAALGWTNDTLGSAIEMNNETSFLLGMGHPNVTSSGFLTLYLALQSQNTLSDLSSSNLESIRSLTESTYEIAPNDLFHIYTLRDFSKEYLHAAIGFENDVARYNINIMNSSNCTNSTTGSNNTCNFLTFIYFKKTFWVDYPICVLEDAPWVNGRKAQLGNWFKNFVNSTNNTNKLLKYGVRPAGRNDTNYSFTLNGEKITVPGINLNITKNESVPVNVSITIDDITKDISNNITSLTINNIQNLTRGWRDVKRPAYILLFQDVSSDVAKSVSSTKTRWVYAKKALPHIVRVVEEKAIIDLDCFSKTDTQTKCSKQDWTSANVSILENSRNPLLNYLDKRIVTTSQKNNGFYTELTDKIRELKKIKESTSNYTFFVVAISGNDKTKKTLAHERITALLEEAQPTSTNDLIHVYPILFFGKETNKTNSTWDAMGRVARITNGRRWAADSDIEDVFETLKYYF